MLSEDLGLLVELSSQLVKKYPVLGPPLIVASIPIVPVDAPEFIQRVKGVASEAIPEETPPR